MFTGSSRSEKISSSMVLVSSLVFLSVVLMGSAAVAEETENRSRNHKAMQFGRSAIETKTDANEHLPRDYDGQDDEDNYDVEEDDEDVGESERLTTTGASSSEQHNDVTTPSSVNYVATTPKIVKSSEVLSRYEQGLEDYEEAADREERENSLQQQQQQQQQQQPVGGFLMKPILTTLFNVMSSAFSSKRSFQVVGPDPASVLSEWNRMAGVDNGDDSSSGGGPSTSDDADNQNGNSTAVGAAGSARYIQGDPLNGYYDFVITEGSYKFWAIFQILTAILVIYSTFAAIYYSKVSPLTSDYDYIEYLNGGRSFAGARSMDGISGPAGDMWNGLLEKPWFNIATNSFVFVMNAIENVPK
ncbi:uncharacterized protein LOC135708214 [Ochlerotatus camptorhynchus]|uniref:uncharacterized protein LOC135708214 n=1 Tax=Ochlerotatus camptorhynchus TaxID=644619 RepID=UPI0031CFC99E